MTLRGWDGRRAWFTALLLAAVLARGFHLFSPPDDAHEFRQTQTLMYAASYAHSASPLAPQVWWYGPTPRIAVLEFPLYSYAVHLAAAALPVSLLVAGRLLSLALSLLALWLFDRLCLELDHPRRRAATILFAIAPVAIFYGHAVQPETLMLAAMVGAAYAFVRAARARPQWPLVAVAAGCLALAATIKPTALVMLAPALLYLGWRQARLPQALVVLGLAGAAAGGWAAYDRAVLGVANPSWYAVNSGRLFGPVESLWSTAYYSLLLGRATTILLPPLAVGLVVAAVGRRAHPFYWAWLAGALASLVIFPRLNAEHFYYQLPMVPALAALAAYAAPGWPRRLPLQVGAAAVLAAAVGFGASDLYRESPVYYDAGVALAAHSTPGAPVLVLSSYGGAVLELPMVLYYADRQGWNLGPFASGAELDQYPACDLVIVRDGTAGSAPPPGWRTTADAADFTVAHRTTCPSP